MKFIFIIILVFQICDSQAQKVDSLKQIPIHLKAIQHDYELGLSQNFYSYSYRFIGKTPNGEISSSRLWLNKHLLTIEDQLIYYSGHIEYYSNIEFFSNRQNKNIFNSGFSFNPFGFKWVYKPNKFISPFGKLNGGFLFLEDKFPNNNGLAFNFTYELNLGFDLNLIAIGNKNSKAKIVFYYSFFHFSNAELASVNPGMDSNNLVVGLQWSFNTNNQSK